MITLDWAFLCVRKLDFIHICETKMNVAEDVIRHLEIKNYQSDLHSLDKGKGLNKMLSNQYWPHYYLIVFQASLFVQKWKLCAHMLAFMNSYISKLGHSLLYWIRSSFVSFFCHTVTSGVPLPHSKHCMVFTSILIFTANIFQEKWYYLILNRLSDEIRLMRSSTRGHMAQPFMTYWNIWNEIF